MVYNSFTHMRSFFQNRKLTLLLAILALGALTVLAIGLKDVQFNAAQPFGRFDETERTKPAENLGQIFSNVSVQSQIVFWGAALLLTFLVGLLLSPEGRKYLIRLFIRIFSTYMLIYFLLRNYGDRLAALASINLGAFNIGQVGTEGSELPPPKFVPPQEASWMSYVVSVLFILFSAFVAWRIWVFFRQFVLPKLEEKPLEELAKIARSSLHNLSQGGDTTDVIMKCYFRMSSVVSDKRQLYRKESMTPAEFALRLEHAGLPGDAVQRLTRLFENVRYGGHGSGQKEVNEAIACLTSILNYCGESV